jgi:hypothetical protein
VFEGQTLVSDEQRKFCLKCVEGYTPVPAQVVKRQRRFVYIGGLRRHDDHDIHDAREARVRKVEEESGYWAEDWRTCVQINIDSGEDQDDMRRVVYKVICAVLEQFFLSSIKERVDDTAEPDQVGSHSTFTEFFGSSADLQMDYDAWHGTFFKKKDKLNDRGHRVLQFLRHFNLDRQDDSDFNVGPHFSATRACYVSHWQLAAAWQALVSTGSMDQIAVFERWDACGIDYATNLLQHRDKTSEDVFRELEHKWSLEQRRHGDGSDHENVGDSEELITLKPTDKPPPEWFCFVLLSDPTGEIKAFEEICARGVDVPHFQLLDARDEEQKSRREKYASNCQHKASATAFSRTCNLMYYLFTPLTVLAFQIISIKHLHWLPHSTTEPYLQYHPTIDLFIRLLPLLYPLSVLFLHAGGFFKHREELFFDEHSECSFSSFRELVHRQRKNGFIDCIAKDSAGPAETDRFLREVFAEMVSHQPVVLWEPHTVPVEQVMRALSSQRSWDNLAREVANAEPRPAGYSDGSSTLVAYTARRYKTFIVGTSIPAVLALSLAVGSHMALETGLWGLVPTDHDDPSWSLFWFWVDVGVSPWCLIVLFALLGLWIWTFSQLAHVVSALKATTSHACLCAYFEWPTAQLSDSSEHHLSVCRWRTRLKSTKSDL